MDSENSEYVENTGIIFEVKPNLFALCLYLLICLGLVLAGFIFAIDFAKNYDALEPGMQFLAVLGIALLVFFPGLYLVFSIFFLLRGAWVMRVTREALFYRHWFHTIKAPWEKVDRINVYVKTYGPELDEGGFSIFMPRLVSRPNARYFAMKIIWKDNRRVNASGNGKTDSGVCGRILKIHFPWAALPPHVIAHRLLTYCERYLRENVGKETD